MLSRVFSLKPHLWWAVVLWFLQTDEQPPYVDKNGMTLEERKKINFFLKFRLEQNSRSFSPYNISPLFAHQSCRKRSFHLLPEPTVRAKGKGSWLGCCRSRADPLFSRCTTSSSIDSSQEWMCVLIFQSDSAICGNWTSAFWGNVMPFHPELGCSYFCDTKSWRVKNKVIILAILFWVEHIKCTF